MINIVGLTSLNPNSERKKPPTIKTAPKKSSYYSKMSQSALIEIASQPYFDDIFTYGEQEEPKAYKPVEKSHSTSTSGLQYTLIVKVVGSPVD